MLAPSAGEVYLGEDRITALRQHPRVKRGLTRTFQINTLFPGLTVLESVVLAILQREGLAARWWLPVAGYREQIDEAMATARRRCGSPTTRTRAPRSCPTVASGWWRSRWLSPRGPRILLLDEPAAGIPAAESAEVFGVDRGAARSR